MLGARIREWYNRLGHWFESILEVEVNSARVRSIFVYVLIVVAIVVLLLQFRRESSQIQQLSLTQLATAVEEGQVKKIVVDENTLRITLTNGDEAESRKEPTSTAPEQLAALNVPLEKIQT